MTAWQSLIELLPVEQREQLAELIVRQLSRGYGRVEIEIKGHQLAVLREVIVTPVRREMNGDESHL